MKPVDPLSPDVQARLHAAVAEALAAAEGAEASASNLRTLVLQACGVLAPESSVLHEITTVLLHSAQNFRRVAGP